MAKKKDVGKNNDSLKSKHSFFKSILVIIIVIIVAILIFYFIFKHFSFSEKDSPKMSPGGSDSFGNDLAIKKYSYKEHQFSKDFTMNCTDISPKEVPNHFGSQAYKGSKKILKNSWRFCNVTKK